MPHEFNGEAYNKASVHQKEWGNKIISTLHFKGDEKVLDLGCGDGVLTSQLAELVPQGMAVGLDSSLGMIEVASKLRRSNLEFKLQDINFLDFGEEFDLIFSNATLHWVKDHPRLLDSSFKCLKQGGMARFNFAADGNCSHFLKVIKLEMARPEYSRYFQKFEWPWFMPTVVEYEDLAKSSKFKEVKVWGEVADRYFPDKDAMIKWIDQPSIVPLLEYVPDMEKKGFRNCVVEKILGETMQSDGSCFETFRRINLSARKL